MISWENKGGCRVPSGGCSIEGRGHFQGVVVSELEHESKTDPFFLGITGGTGDFKFAKGSIKVIPPKPVVTVGPGPAPAARARPCLSFVVSEFTRTSVVDNKQVANLLQPKDFVYRSSYFVISQVLRFCKRPGCGLQGSVPGLACRRHHHLPIGSVCVYSRDDTINITRSHVAFCFFL